MKSRRLHASFLAILLPAIAQFYFRGGLFDSSTTIVVKVKEPTPKEVREEVKELHHNVSRQEVSERKKELIASDARESQEEDKELYHNESSMHEKDKKIHHNVSIAQQYLFNVSDLDWSKQASCGVEKCYFQSKSDNHVGYLLAPKRLRRYKALQKAWKLAEHLRQEYDIRHFVMAPPIKVKVTKSLESDLNRNLWNEKLQRRYGKRYKRFRKGKTVVVQQVMTAPKDRLLLGCKDSKLRVFKKLVDKFALKIKHKESFARRFNESYTQMKVLLHKEPCLALDFQVFVDTSGQIYHLDFDRCINTRTAQKKRRNYNSKHLDETSCYKAIVKLEQRMYQALEKSERRE